MSYFISLGHGFPKGRGGNLSHLEGKICKGEKEEKGGKLKKGINFYTRYPGVADEEQKK